MPNKWQTVLDEIKNTISDMAFEIYFKDTKFVSEEDNTVTFSVLNSLTKSTVEKKYHDKVLAALKSAGFNCNNFKVIVSSNNATKSVIRRPVEVIPGAPVERRSNTTTSISQSLPNSSAFAVNNNGLSPKYRLDNYVVGSNNDLAVSAARAIIDNPGSTQYNPLFLYGGSGYGKTHLIQAIGNELQKNYPNLKILYVTIEEFYHDFVTAMRKKLDGFQNKYRKLDVLIVDDFQFIEGKQASQDEFFHTFNELYKQNKQVIVSADRLPSQIATVDPRLASRLTMGISIDIQLPDFETRCAILKAKADLLGETVDNATIEYLAENFSTNIRDLEGELNRVLLLANVRGVPTSEVIGEITPVVQSVHRVSSKQLIDRVAKYYNLTSKDLLGTSRMKDIKNARQVAMYLMNEELGLSTVKIGNEFNKDHTTIMHGIKVVKENIQKDFSVREQISELRGKIYAN